MTKHVWEESCPCPMCGEGYMKLTQEPCYCAATHAPCTNCTSSWLECTKCGATPWFKDFPNLEEAHPSFDLTDDFIHLLNNPPVTHKVVGQTYEVSAIITYIRKMGELVDRYERAMAMRGLNEVVAKLTPEEISRLASEGEYIMRDRT